MSSWKHYAISVSYGKLFLFFAILTFLKLETDIFCKRKKFSFKYMFNMYMTFSNSLNNTVTADSYENSVSFLFC